MGRVITITRQFGSLGRLIGQEVAKRLGFEYYDRDIIEGAAEKLGKHVYELAEYDGHTYTDYGRMGFPLGLGTKRKQRELFEIEKELIEEFARSKDCVIVGRGADCILTEAGAPQLYRVFIYAPYNDRLSFCLSRLGLTAEAAEVYMEKVDRARESFYREFTNETFSSMRYRDLLINSAAMSLEQNASMICNGALNHFDNDR